MQRQYNLRLSISSFLMLFFYLQTIFTQAYLFKVPYVPEEPRLEMPGLFSITIEQGYIKTKHQSHMPHLPNVYGYDCLVNIYQNIDKGFFIGGKSNYQDIHYTINNQKRTTTRWKNHIIQAGWTYSYQETTELDFIDITLKTGIAKYLHNRIDSKQNVIENNTCSISTGQISIGIFEWLTIGTNLELVIPIYDKTSTLTSSIEWQMYLVADHIVKGFSTGIGYGLYCEPNQARDYKQHIFTLYAAYDFTKLNHWFGPRLGFNYCTIITRKNNLNLSNTQGVIGFELAFLH